jgi:hypothetical protein
LKIENGIGYIISMEIQNLLYSYFRFKLYSFGLLVYDEIYFIENTPGLQSEKRKRLNGELGTRNLKRDRQYHVQKNKMINRQTMIDKVLHRKPKIEKQELNYHRRMSSSALEG